MLLKLCNWLASKLPGITISLPDPTDGVKKPYLSRYYFLGKDRKFFNIFLHQFHRSDMDVGEDGQGLLHSHPFKWSLSFILVSGYSEERLLADGRVIKKTYRPFGFNFLTEKDYHRVDLDNGKAWTIFITGSRSKSGDWFFWDRVSKEKRHWTTSPNAVA